MAKKPIQKLDIEEPEFPEEKGTKWNAEQRRRYLKKLALDIGLYNINKTELAKKFCVNRNQVYLDINALVKGGLDKNELQHSTMVISNAVKKVMKEMQGILVKTSNTVYDDAGKVLEVKPILLADKIRAAATLLQAAEKHTDFLEKFGYKDIQTPTSETEIIVRWGKEKDDKRKK